MLKIEGIPHGSRVQQARTASTSELRNAGDSGSPAKAYVNNGFSAAQASALKSQVKFGDSTLPKLTWTELEPIIDPAFGKIERRLFSNGMEFYGLQRQDIPLVSYGELIKTGAANETEKENGVSHFLEHLIFKGTPKLPAGEADRLLEDMGAGVNAWTSYDGTFYYIYNTPKEALKEAIKIKAEMIQNTLIPPAELLKERFTVVEEIKRDKNNKRSQQFKVLMHNVWADHPYKRTVLGPQGNIGDDIRAILDPTTSPEEQQTWVKLLNRLKSQQNKTAPVDEAPLSASEKQKFKHLKQLLQQRKIAPQALLDQYPLNPKATPLSEENLRSQFKLKDLSRQEILDYYGQHYAPKNRAIFAVGDFDMPEVLNTIAEEYNHPFPPNTDGRNFSPDLGTRPARAYNKPLSTTGVKKEELIRSDMKIAMLAQGFDGPKPTQPQTKKALMSLELLAKVLGGGESSRLYQQLVEKDQLATSFGMGFYELKERSMFYLVAQTTPQKLETVKAKIREQLSEVIANGINPEELQKAKIQFKTELADESEEQMNVINALVQAVRGGGLQESLGNSLKTLESITPADLQEAARLFLNEENQKTVSLVPNDYGKTPSKTKPAVPPKLQFAGRLGVLDQSTHLEGGTELIVRHRPGALKTAISLRIKGGNRADSLPGINDILAEMITRGTEKLTASDLQHWLDSKGLSLGVETQQDSTVIQINGLSDYKKEMFDVLGALLKGPAMREADLDFVKTQIKEHYQATLDTKPQAVVAQNLTEAMTPAGHPYGATTGRLVQNFDQFTPERLQEAFKSLFKRGNMTLSVVGDVPMEDAKAMAEGMLDDVPAGETTLATPPTIQLTQNKLMTQSKEGLSQAEIMRGWTAPKGSDADRIPLMMLNGILRAGMSSRLFQTFREKEKGLCYQVSTTYEPLKEAGTFKFYIGTDPANIRKVLDLFQKEVDLLTDTLPSDAEMKRAKLLMKSSILASTQSAGDVSSELTRHRGLDALSREEMAEQLDAVTPAQVRAVAQKYLTQPSITSIIAPKAALENHQLPIDETVLI